MNLAEPMVQERPQLKMLSENQVRKIHNATLRILEETGVIFHEPRAIEILRDAGAKVKDNGLVKIPSYMVEEALRSAPSRVTIWDRSGERALDLAGRNIYFGTGSDTPNVLDPFTGKRRHATKNDVRNTAVVCDYLKNIDFVMCMGIASDVPTQTSDLHHFEQMVTNTTKPLIFTAWSEENLRAIHQMCIAVAGGEKQFCQKPFAINYSEATSPLQHTEEATQKLMYCAEHDIPIIYVTGGWMGGSLPVTVPATVAMTNAEDLSGLVLHQLKRKGARYIGAGSKSPMDMRTGNGGYGAPESYILETMQADLYHFYDLPTFGKAGCSDSKAFDQQVAIEATHGLFLTGLAGVNLIHDVGYMESGLTSSLESIVMCDEIVGMVKRFVRSVDIDDEMLGVEVIRDVGPGGNFMMHDHTLKHFRDQIWEPSILNHKNYDRWKEEGSKELRELINEHTRYILENHKPQSLSEVIRKKLGDIITNTEKVSQ
jgi:trimethylamine--corrinoid protein Co-methyltransferase